MDWGQTVNTRRCIQRDCFLALFILLSPIALLYCVVHCSIIPRCKLLCYYIALSIALLYRVVNGSAIILRCPLLNSIALCCCPIIAQLYCGVPPLLYYIALSVALFYCVVRAWTIPKSSFFAVQQNDSQAVFSCLLELSGLCHPSRVSRMQHPHFHCFIICYVFLKSLVFLEIGYNFFMISLINRRKFFGSIVVLRAYFRVETSVLQSWECVRFSVRNAFWEGVAVISISSKISDFQVPFF